MHCDHCQTPLTNAFKLQVCPICGTMLNEKNRKPSFERTWAMMSEDTMKKHADQKQFDETWSWYEKAIQNDPGETAFAARFAKVYSQFKPSLSALKTKAATKASSTQLAVLFDDSLPAWMQILGYGLLFGDPGSVLQLAQAKPEFHSVILEILEIHNRQNIKSDLPDLPLEADLASRLHQIQLPVEILPLYFSFKQDYPMARAAFKAAMQVDLDESLILKSGPALSLLANLSNDLQKRLDGMVEDMQKEDTAHVLEGLYRPLFSQENEFAHLYRLPSALPGYLQDHQAEWISQSLGMIEADQALRGIHLALQTLKNQHPDLGQACDTILSKQYEKAYLRPFKEIEKTDERFS
ncbi:hypothetical protein IM774_01605 [Erysipelotrichaceae bacterium RD49]|nr:hypothetical protein [Erysipelotrichaceae bacterium RD49]